MSHSSQNVSQEPEWDTYITPQSKWLNFRFRELWKYRDLMLLFVRRDFVAMYKQTILGYAWHFIQPFITSVLFTLVFGSIAGLPTDGVPHLLFYMSGIVCWNYFSRSFINSGNIFVQNAQIFGKVYFPRLILPIANTISAIISFLIQFGFFLAFWIYYYVQEDSILQFQWNMLFLWPLFIIMLGMLGLSTGIVISSLTTKYRDLTVLVTFGVQLLMYMTPVIYPASSVPSYVADYLHLNPVAPLIEAFRYTFLGKGVLDWGWIAYSAGFTAVVFFIGVMLFNKVEKSFMDTV